MSDSMRHRRYSIESTDGYRQIVTGDEVQYQVPSHLIAAVLQRRVGERVSDARFTVTRLPDAAVGPSPGGEAMKDKHVKIRIEQCLALAKASNCPRRKFGALLLDPVRNVILMDGYNGGPRGGGRLCGGAWCHRDGFPADVVGIGDEGMFRYDDARGFFGRPVYLRGEVLTIVDDMVDADAYIAEMVAEYPPIKSGTHVEIGCHHAEMNVICNAAAAGVRASGAWLIVTGEPCKMCAKLIHHAGITKVIVVGGGYAGTNGVGYLRRHGVDVDVVDGPTDPRGEETS